MMRILVISFSNQYILQETTLLMQNFYNSQEVEVYSITSSNQIFTKFNKSEFNYFVDCPEKPGLSFNMFNTRLINKVVDIINKINPSNILFYSSHIWNLSIINKINRKIITAHLIHDVNPHDKFLKNILINRYNVKVSKMINKIVVHSVGYLELSKNKFKKNPSDIIYLPVLRRFTSYTSVSNSGKFIFFGRISKYKGIDNLVKIVEGCPEQFFLIIGKFAREAIKYKKALKKFHNVVIDDSYVTENEMEKYMTESDWFILPYNSASQSGVIPDAYVHSRPVIAFDVGNLSEQVDKKTGFLIAKNDIDAFIDQVKKCSKKDFTELEKYSNNAFCFGVKNYSFQNNKTAFISIFR